MNKHEKILFAVWAIVLFPLLIIYLVMCKGLALEIVSPLLTFMASISGVYIGARAFSEWNSTPDVLPQPDDGGH